MKTAFSCLLAILWPFLYAFSQSSPAVTRPLSVGDAVPDYLIRNLVQYKTPTAHISDFKNSLLILDFMATTCSGCMGHLSHMDSLQSAYKTQLLLLPVTYESKAKLLSVLQKRPASNKINFPFVTQDSVLRSLFPHQFISHLVWIYKGTVKAITNPEYVTAQNIAAVLRNDNIRWPVKKDVGRYDPAYPLLAANNEAVAPANEPALRYYSVMPAYMNGFASGITTYTDTAANLYRFTVMNHSILQLYLIAFEKSLHFPAPLIHLETRDSSRFFFNKKGYRGDWFSKNGFCYQASLPLTLPDAVKRERMIADLDFYLGLHGRMEQRSTHCYLLRRDSSVTPARRPAGPSIEISGIALKLNDIYGGLPCIDEVPGSDTTYIEEPANYTDIPALARHLLGYGIRLVEEERVMEMLVIKDNHPVP